MARQAQEEPNAVKVILQNLARRPNVRSTLILSRKDGTIISASGSIVDDLKASSMDARKEDLSSDSITESAKTSNGDSATRQPAVRASRAQILASNIYNFVVTAAALGSSLRSIEEEEDMHLARDEASTQENVDLESHSGDDVQLLRLRLKKQEVIIFPDPNYLCCVVQDLEKNAR